MKKNGKGLQLSLLFTYEVCHIFYVLLITQRHVLRWVAIQVVYIPTSICNKKNSKINAQDKFYLFSTCRPIFYEFITSSMNLFNQQCVSFLSDKIRLNKDNRGNYEWFHCFCLLSLKYPMAGVSNVCLQPHLHERQVSTLTDLLARVMGTSAHSPTQNHPLFPPQAANPERLGNIIL